MIIFIIKFKMDIFLDIPNSITDNAFPVTMITPIVKDYVIT